MDVTVGVYFQTDLPTWKPLTGRANVAQYIRTVNRRTYVGAVRIRQKDQTQQAVDFHDV